MLRHYSFVLSEYYRTVDASLSVNYIIPGMGVQHYSSDRFFYIIPEGEALTEAPQGYSSYKISNHGRYYASPEWTNGGPVTLIDQVKWLPF